MMVLLSETETEQCEMTMPQKWYFMKGDFVMAGSQVRVVHKIDCAGVEIELEGTFAFQFHRWQDVIKLFDIRVFVQVVGGEFIGRSGFVQDNTDEIYIEILDEIGQQGIDICVCRTIHHSADIYHSGILGASQ